MGNLTSEITFCGSFCRNLTLWNYEFYLPSMALIVNADGEMTISCQEAVVHVSNDGIDWVNSKVKMERRDDEVIVHVMRDGEWKHAASFVKANV